MSKNTRDIATLAGGCFWCTEAIFQRLNGVISVSPGYSGGTVVHPTYEQVCSGNTGHAEAIQITYETTIISYETLLDVFFHLHDPTTQNRQGNDVGTQYRSVIFYHDENQKKIALELKNKIPHAITQIAKYTNFYSAGAYHQNYFNKNSYAPYCQAVIDPKIRKLFKEYKEIIKPDLKFF